jgi:hypothetical protein
VCIAAFSGTFGGAIIVVQVDRDNTDEEGESEALEAGGGLPSRELPALRQRSASAMRAPHRDALAEVKSKTISIRRGLQ